MKHRTLLVLAAGSAILFLAIGNRQGFGLFQDPLSKELGWGREIFSLAIGLQNLLWGASQPFLGAIADRYGPGRVVAVGGLLYAAGLYIMSITTTPEMLYLSAGLMIGLSLSALSFAVVFGAIARVVPQEVQGRALGIAGAVGSAGQLFVVLGNSALLDAQGWRTTFFIGSILALLLIPLAIPIRRRGETGSGGPIGGAGSLKAALGEAFEHRGFWLLCAGFFVCGFHVTFIATHFPAYITDLSHPEWVAGSALAVIGPMPGMLSSRRLTSFERCQAWMRRSAAVISRSNDINWRTSPCRQRRASGEMRSSSSSPITARSALTCGRPTGATMPNSARCARIALTSMVRCRTMSSRVRCSISTLCCSADFTATKRMVGRVTASQIAAASAASFLFRFT